MYVRSIDKTFITLLSFDQYSEPSLSSSLSLSLSTSSSSSQFNFNTHIKFSYFSIYLFALSLRLLLSRHRHCAFPLAFTMRSTSRTGQEVRAATGPAGRQPPRRAACSPGSGPQCMDAHRRARRGSSRSGIGPAPRRTGSQS